MKKLTKLSALLLVAAVFFAGCKDPDDSTGNSTGGGNANPLFSESDTTVEIAANEIGLSNGEWTYKEICIEGGDIWADEYQIIITDEGINVTSGVMYYSGVGYLEKYTKDQLKEEATKRGITVVFDGDKASYSTAIDQESLTEFTIDFFGKKCIIDNTK